MTYIYLIKDKNGLVCFADNELERAIEKAIDLKNKDIRYYDIEIWFNNRCIANINIL